MVAQLTYNGSDGAELAYRFEFYEVGKREMRALAGWQNSFVIVGSSAGALIGLQFVVLSLIANKPSVRVDSQTGGTFSPPTAMTLEQMLAKLPTDCAIGVKTSSGGNQKYWLGYKLHLDTADGKIPISAILTRASVHDSPLAIPVDEDVRPAGHLAVRCDGLGL